VNPKNIFVDFLVSSGKLFDSTFHILPNSSFMIIVTFETELRWRR